MSNAPYDPVLTDQMQLAANDIALITDTNQRVAWIVFLLQEIEDELGAEQAAELLLGVQNHVSQRLQSGSWPAPATA
jgi:hypothetical protein